MAAHQGEVATTAQNTFRSDRISPHSPPSHPTLWMMGEVVMIVILAEKCFAQWIGKGKPAGIDPALSEQINATTRLIAQYSFRVIVTSDCDPGEACLVVSGKAGEIGYFFFEML